MTDSITEKINQRCGDADLIPCSGDDHSDAAWQSMVREDPLVWWENCVDIVNRYRVRVREKQANVLQHRLAEVIAYCRERNIYCPIVVLKPRSKGISTVSVGIGQWEQKRKPTNMLIMGGQDWQCATLWKIYQLYAESDDFPWGVSGQVLDSEARWSNGSGTRRQVAGGKAPGRSDVFQYCVFTEFAWWGHDTSVRNPEEALTGVLAAVPKDGFSVVIIESTSAGGSGAFFRKWDDGIPAAQFLAGHRKPGAFIQVFAGVFEFPDSYIAPESPKEEAELLTGIGARNEAEKREEGELRAKHGLNAGQIKFWRTLLGECGNDPNKRLREFPPRPEDAFRAAQPCRFNRAHLDIMRDEARQARVSYGMLDQLDKDQPLYTWRPMQDSNEANFAVFEPPVVEHRYIISVDNAGGRATGEDKSDTDCHAVTVLRAGYFDTRAGTGIWKPPAVVAAINPFANEAKGQRVDIDILAEWVWRLHVFYGRCLVAPEANNDRGLILLLRQRGALVYQETKPATHVESNKPSGKFGVWMRGGEYEAARRWYVENLVRAVREHGQAGEGVFIPFMWILDEMEHFVTDPDTGKDEAMSGWHDDWVMSMVIGLAHVHGGTVYTPPRLASELPKDLRLAEEREAQQHRPGDRI